MHKNKGHLVLVRHGESRWNLSDRFTGWVDVPLSENGIREAQRVAEFCKEHEYAAAYTSDLTRAQETLLIILARQDKTAVFHHPEEPKYGKWIARSNREDSDDLPVHASVLLNERYYGDLQGMNKKEAAKKFGKETVFAWRRGYREHPPGGESLMETYARVRPYLQEKIIPRVRKGEDILVVAHGNTLRGVIMHLEGISEKGISSVDLPEAHPLVYTFSEGAFERTEGDYRLDRPLR